MFRNGCGSAPRFSLPGLQRVERKVWKAPGLFALALVFSATSSAGVNTFTSIGPSGGNIEKVVYHPTDSSIAYAVASSGFYRSNDGGASWRAVHNTMANAPRDIAVNASRPNAVFTIAMGSGVLSSIDSGETLKALSPYPGLHEAGTHIFYSVDGTMLYTASQSAIYRSADNGSSWTRGGRVQLPDGTPLSISAVAVHPTQSLQLYLGTSDGRGFSSSDGGHSWAAWTVPAVNSINSIAIANTQPMRIWIGTNQGTWFKDENQAWFRTRVDGSSVVAIDPSNSDVVYVGGHLGLSRTPDNGANWDELLGASLAGGIYSVAISPSGSDTLMISGSSGIARTVDGGANWAASHNGITALLTDALFFSERSDRIYLSTTHQGTFALEGAGRTVIDLGNNQLRQFSAPQAAIFGAGFFVHPGETDHVYFGLSGQGLSRSTTGGSSWTHLWDIGFSGTHWMQNILTTSDDGRSLLATNLSEIALSDDGGDTWEAVNNLPFDDIASVSARAQSDPKVVYLSGSISGQNNYSLYKTVDGGRSWAALETPASPSISSLAVDPSNDDIVYFGNGLQLFKSVDGGETWVELPVAETPGNIVFYALAIDPQNPHILYAGGVNALSRSVDAGASWQSIPQPALTGWDLRALSVDALRPSSVIAGLHGAGVYEISIQPDLEISVTLPTSIPPGAPSSYRYRLQNKGPFDATGVRATVQLPTDAANASVSSESADCSINGTLASCDLTTLKVDQSIEFTITSVQPSAGSMELVGTVRADQPDAVATNNEVLSTIQVVVPATPAPQPTPRPATGGGGGGGGTSMHLLLILGALGCRRFAKRRIFRISR